MRVTDSLFLAAIVTLAACGGGGSADAADGRTFGTANSFTLRATSDANADVELDASEISRFAPLST